MAFLPTNPLHSLKISHSTDEENLFDDQGLLKLVIISFILISHEKLKLMESPMFAIYSKTLNWFCKLSLEVNGGGNLWFVWLQNAQEV